MTHKPVHLFDMTLRDGEQSSSFNPSPEQRAQIARSLDAAGVSVIELASTDFDAESLSESREIALDIRSSTVCCLSEMDFEHLQTAKVFLGGIDKSRIHLYLNRKRMQQVESFPEEARGILDQMGELIIAAWTVCAEVEFSSWDATRFEFDTLASVIKAALAAGASIISISDTVGTATTEKIRKHFQSLRADLSGLDSVSLSLHAHNHEGRAVENVLAAIECGVTQIEGTINGVGPAGGNTNLVEVINLLESPENVTLGELNSNRFRAIGVEAHFIS